jgi:hypothetical protein
MLATIQKKKLHYQLLNEQLHQQLYTYYTHITRQVRSDFCLFQTSIKITINNIKKSVVFTTVFLDIEIMAVI